MQNSVLVVEDDADVRQLMSVILEREQLDVDEAVNGQKALQRLDERRYDLVVLDIMLPLLNGFEVYEKICSLDPRPAVIVISAIARYVGDRFAADTIVLQKPFLHEKFREAVMRKLGRV